MQSRVVSGLSPLPPWGANAAKIFSDPSIVAATCSLNNNSPHKIWLLANMESPKLLEMKLQAYKPCFAGKESEGNWSQRETAVVKMRQMCAIEAAEHPTVWLKNIKELLDGILKTVNSLRTTVSTNGCLLVQELAKSSNIDSMVEILLQNLIKLCANTKPIARSNGNDTVLAVIGNSSYHLRLTQHIHSACQDKNVQPRKYACEWLKKLIKRHPRSSIEHHGGLDLIEKSIKFGLEDRDKDVREAMRATYWMFARRWAERSEVIMAGLDKTKQDQLIADSNNPNPPPPASPSKSVPSAKAVLSKSTGSVPSAKPSLKEIKAKLAAQKKAQGPVEQPSPEAPVVSKATNVAATPAPASTKITNITSTPAPASSKARNVTAAQVPAPSKAANLTAAPMRFRKKPTVKPNSAVANPAETTVPVAPSQPNSTNNQAPKLASLQEALKSSGPSQPNVTNGQPSTSSHLPEVSKISAPIYANSAHRRSVSSDAVTYSSPRTATSPKAPAFPTPRAASSSVIEHNIWDSAVDRIRARRLDIHGFRKLQAVLRDDNQDNKVESLLEPLCLWLEQPPKASDPFESQDIRAQVVITIRQMLTEGLFSQEHYPRILCALLDAKDFHATKGYLVCGLQKTISYIVWHCNLLDCLGAVCDLMEVPHSLDTDEMGLLTLGAMLHRVHETSPKEKTNDSSFEKKDESLVQRLGKIGTACLQSEHLPVRKVAIEFAQEFWHCVPEDDYFRLIASGGTNQQNLLTYYLSRHKQLQDHIDF